MTFGINDLGFVLELFISFQTPFDSSIDALQQFTFRLVCVICRLLLDKFDLFAMNSS